MLAQVVGVSKVAYVRLSSNTSDTAKRVIALKDARCKPWSYYAVFGNILFGAYFYWFSRCVFCRNVEIKLVLWGERADEFDSQLVYDAGQESAVVGVLQQ